MGTFCIFLGPQLGCQTPDISPRFHQLLERSLLLLLIEKSRATGPGLVQGYFTIGQMQKTIGLSASSHLRLSPDQQPEEIQAFIESLPHLKNLVSLTFSSFHPIHQPLLFANTYFSLVFNNLQFLTQLKELELRFYFFKKMENTDIQHLSSMLQCLGNLKNLSINLPQLQSPDEGLVSISQALKHMTNLKTLDLKCSSNFSHESLRALSNNVAQKQHLTSLCLDLCSSQRNQNSLPVTSTIKQSLVKLFTFWKSKNLTPFFSDIQNFTQLSTLKLQLSAIHNSPQEWKYLSLALKQFKKLSSLHLNLPQFDSKKDFRGLNELLSCFKGLSKLMRLELHFEGDRISDKEVKILSSHLAGCQSLSHLNLQFKKAAQLKDESLYFLLSGIRGLLTLKYLCLLFQKEGAFGDKAVSDFLEGLTALKDLSRLYFVYNIGSMFTNHNAPLPANLKGYENLRHLTYFVVQNFRYI